MLNIEKIKQYFLDLKTLIWPFKWYILAYIFIASAPIYAYFSPPAVDDPIWGAQATLGEWNYINQDLYRVSAKYAMIINMLIFFLGTSNMRNHPRIAKLIFLSPWITSLWYLGLLMFGIDMY